MSELREPIAADALPESSDHRIVLFGAPGTGKTAQILTLPRPTFVYAFEASALATLRGAKDVHVVPFFPRNPSDANSVLARSIQKGGRREFDFLSGAETPNPEYGHLYLEFARDLTLRLEQNWWQKEGFHTLALDGLSTLSRHILSRVGFLQEKVKADDRRTDYMQAGNVTGEVFSYLSTQTPIFVLGLHVGQTMDERTGRPLKRLELPGSARNRLPTISTVCWRTMLAKDDSKTPAQTRFCAQTFPDRDYEFIRPGPFNAPDVVDLTIEDWSHPELFGLGKMIAAQK